MTDDAAAARADEWRRTRRASWTPNCFHSRDEMALCSNCHVEPPPPPGELPRMVLVAELAAAAARLPDAAIVDRPDFHLIEVTDGTSRTWQITVREKGKKRRR